MSRNTKAKLISALLVLIVVSMNILTSYAARKDELNHQQSEIDNKIKETEKEIQHVHEEISASMASIRDLTAKITDYELEISDLVIKIGQISQKITESEEIIKQNEEELLEKKTILEKRLVAQYENGTTSYLDLLLGSGSFTDFISNYYLIAELAEYDNELMDAIEAELEKIRTAKAELENNKVEVEKVKKDQEAKQAALASAKKEKQSQVAKLNAEEKSLQAELDQFERDKQSIRNELAEIARKEAAQNGGSTVTVKPSASGYIFPVAGLTRANINNKNYPSYAGHTGVDVNINVIGKSVVAVKAGTVEKSRALKYSNGNYRSYGEYVVINHHDGTMTLYAHGKAGSRRVIEGQKVSQGQVLMTVGNTGNVSPKPSAANPNAGTHLHFEVLINGRPVNPMPYLP